MKKQLMLRRGIYYSYQFLTGHQKKTKMLFNTAYQVQQLDSQRDKDNELKKAIKGVSKPKEDPLKDEYHNKFYFNPISTENSLISMVDDFNSVLCEESSDPSLIEKCEADRQKRQLREEIIKEHNECKIDMVNNSKNLGFLMLVFL